MKHFKPNRRRIVRKSHHTSFIRCLSGERLPAFSHYIGVREYGSMDGVIKCATMIDVLGGERDPDFLNGPFAVMLRKENKS